MIGAGRTIGMAPIAWLVPTFRRVASDLSARWTLAANPFGPPSIDISSFWRYSGDSGRALMESIFLLKFVHVLGASVLFGTGLGIAYFMFMAHRTGHAGVIAVTARFVILADLIFTATAVVVQPVSGVLLAWSIGLSPLEESWIVLSLLLYVLVGLCWLPAVFIQIRMRKLAHDAAVNSKPLPDGYRRLFRVWFALGWPAFAGVLGIFALMTWQPRLW
jgi:uncharacterized membrane protein